MLVLVTGGAGYIGSHAVLELINTGYDVVAIDNFQCSVADEYGEPISLQRVAKLTQKQVPFHKVDTRDRDQLEQIFRKYKFDAVMHFAALKFVSESIADPLKYYDCNVVGSIILIEMCKKYSVKNFVFSSSCTVYGEGTPLPLKEHAITGVNLTSSYGRSKHMVEQILIDLGKAEPEWNIILLRYFNTVGAHASGEIGDNPRLTHNLMPVIGQVAIGNRPSLQIYGDSYETKDGSCVRDYIHVVDVATAHVNAISRIGSEEHIYNLGTGQGYTVKEMVAMYEKVSGKSICAKIASKRPGDVATVVCDPSLALKKLGWKAVYGLHEMCRDSWKWQSKNPNGFSKQ